MQFSPNKARPSQVFTGGQVIDVWQVGDLVDFYDDRSGQIREGRVAAVNFPGTPDAVYEIEVEPRRLVTKQEILLY